MSFSSVPISKSSFILLPSTGEQDLSELGTLGIALAEALGLMER